MPNPIGEWESIFIIRLLDPYIDEINGFGDKYPLNYLAGERCLVKKMHKSLAQEKASFYEQNP